MQIPSYTALLARELSLPATRVAALSPDQEVGICAILEEMLAHFGIPAGYTQAVTLDEVGDPDPVELPPEPVAAPWETPNTDVPTDTVGTEAPSLPEAPGEPKKGVLDGGAGTGKTTLLLTLLRRVAWMKNIPIHVIAPTGKAASRVREVLRQDPDLTGIANNVCTLHAYLYGAPKEEACCPECKHWSINLAELPKQGERECPKCGGLVPLFTPLEMRLTWIPGQGKVDGTGGRKLLVVEEAGMLTKKVVADLCGATSARAYILFVGDQGQVEPIVEGETFGGERDPYPWGVDFEHPTARLTQVHRLAAGNPVIAWATAVREGYVFKPMHHSTRPLPKGDPRLVFHDYCPLRKAVDWLVGHRRAGRSATLICYTNKMRRQVNALVRAELGLSGILAPDDLLVSRSNGPRFMNGETFTISTVEETRAQTFRGIDNRGRPKHPEDMPVFSVTLPGTESKAIILPRAIGETLAIFRDAARDIVTTHAALESHPQYQQDPGGVLRQYGAVDASSLLHVDYGQCITAHMAQGSQWDHVGIIWEGACWGMWRNAQASAIRWLYTAGTRSAVSLTGFALEKQA